MISIMTQEEIEAQVQSVRDSARAISEIIAAGIRDASSVAAMHRNMANVHVVMSRAHIAHGSHDMRFAIASLADGMAWLNV